MSSDGRSTSCAIRLVGIGKQYKRGMRQEKYRTLRDAVMHGVRRFTASGARWRRDVASTVLFWALREISIEVPVGSALGLIGGNGAGKSTLLKILSRVTEPTTGYAELRGRVGSLLEVGTGFHPELTGRENVMLNGAILGMKRWEIQKKFSAIVAFAEVESFIDTPVKHYSSGMYLRLAFAVAAHLEPEILLVDEVLAVGDAAFQKRCLGKMSEVANEGRTVVFVSHNIEAIQRLCSHAVLLEHGRVAACGDTSSVVTQYLSKDYLRPAPGSRVDLSTFARRGTGEARFASVAYGNGSTVAGGKAYSNGPLEFLLEIDSDAARSVSSLSVFLTEQYGTKVINADTVLINRSITLNPGSNRLKLRMKAIHLTPGVYRVGFWLADPIRAMSVSGAYDYLESAFDIEVVSADSNLRHRSGGLVTCDFEVEELR
jgi:lipopolysaccharide transport system ATP-binding protein